MNLQASLFQLANQETEIFIFALKFFNKHPIMITTAVYKPHLPKANRG